MKVKYVGVVPAHNGDLGLVEPNHVYSVPIGKEYAFQANSDYEVVYDKKPKSIGE